ncbi:MULTISPECIES: response regulator [Kocuria]|uniref:LuxR family transcriptional regulator n=1 Tax=Kocuria rosea subsp. polaris TaxID=136273 RepID=A0A0W8I7H4_KOCRO|nr:response regulator transcription factor [Kocuria polaris]KUG55353.1 LuxR family transcriptional regulator [Kocuria polaris]
MIRVLLADDHALVRSGFAMVLSVEDDIEVVAQASDGAEAVAAARDEAVDVALLDVQMPVMDGIEATRRIVGTGCAKVVIVTTFDREDYLFDALAAGASGFLLKNADPDDLVEAVRAVAGGHALLAPEATLRVIRALTTDAPAPAPVPEAAPAPPGPGQRRILDSLTEREHEVLLLVSDGLSNAEIAQRLFLGSATVKTHVSNILAKTGSRDRVQAVVFAHRAGLVG